MNQQARWEALTPILEEKAALERQLKEKNEALIQAAEIFQKIHNAVTDYSIGWSAGCEIARDWAAAGMAQKPVAEVTADYHEWRKWQTTCVCGGCFKANMDLQARHQQLTDAAMPVLNRLLPRGAGMSETPEDYQLVEALAEALGIDPDDCC